MAGTTFKRCSCRNAATGEPLGAACPKLRQARHGGWYYQIRIGGGSAGLLLLLRCEQLRESLGEPTGAEAPLPYGITSAATIRTPF